MNALLSILMADMTGGLTGFLVSTFAIVIFGEIIPQATCSRYALEIGSATLPVVQARPPPLLLARPRRGGRRRQGGVGGAQGRLAPAAIPAPPESCPHPQRARRRVIEPTGHR